MVLTLQLLLCSLVGICLDTLADAAVIVTPVGCLVRAIPHRTRIFRGIGYTIYTLTLLHFRSSGCRCKGTSAQEFPQQDVATERAHDPIHDLSGNSGSKILAT